jgi:hypothetical protein
VRSGFTLLPVLLISIFTIALPSDVAAQSGYRGSSSRGATRSAPRVPISRPSYTSSSSRIGSTGQARAAGMLGNVPRSAGAATRGSSRSSPYRPTTGLRSSVPTTTNPGSTYSLRSLDGRSTTGLTATPRRQQGSRATTSGAPTRPVLGNTGLSPSTNSAIAASRPLRTWTDSTGLHSTQARYLHYEDGVVWLRKADNGLAKIPFARLSPADQAFLRAGSVRTN